MTQETAMVIFLIKEVLVAQPCPTLCNPMDCNPPASSVHGIHQARILEWVDTAFSILIKVNIANLLLDPKYPKVMETSAAVC